LLNYKAMPYKAILDIRCCHPLFFSYYIINHPYTLHYVTQNREASLTLEQEHRRWIELFCDPVNDPKEVVRKRCKFKDTAHAKRAMNESLNGSKRFPAYLRWLGKEFPTLSLLWKKTDVKHTGPKIAAKYEFPLIQDRKLYELADTFGIKIMSEHDGLGVFASADDTELNKKLESLSEHIQSCSMKLFGIPAVVRTKPVYDFLDGDLHAEMAFKMSQYEKELDRLKPVADRLRRNYFSGVREPNTWKEYEAAQAKVNDLKLRYNEVLAYWAERNEKESRAEAFRKRIMEPGEDNLW